MNSGGKTGGKIKASRGLGGPRKTDWSRGSVRPERGDPAVPGVARLDVAEGIRGAPEEFLGRTGRIRFGAGDRAHPSLQGDDGASTGACPLDDPLDQSVGRSEERRVGKECQARRAK